MSRKFIIKRNDTDNSKATEEILIKKLETTEFTLTDELEDDVELIICIGGDGAFLETVHSFNFPSVPFIGVNTGHLGFFQEISPDALDEFITNYRNEKYSIQPMRTVKANVYHDGRKDEFTGLNEIIVKCQGNYTIHLNISIGGKFIERFSGDGVLISSPAGSTAYNYSLGGSIVDPRLELLQVTPIAPMNTTAYRSFTSSILLPPDLSIDIDPDVSGSKGLLNVTYDGFGRVYESVDNVEVKLSDVKVNLLRFENYDFWNKVKTKFL